MAANTVPIFTLVPVIGRASVSVANANRDGTGTLETLITGGTDGTRIDRIVITALVTTTAGMIRFFLDDATNKYLVKEIPVTAVTPSGTAIAYTFEWVRTDGEPLFVLPSGYMLKASTVNAQAMHIVAHGGNY